MDNQESIYQDEQKLLKAFKEGSTKAYKYIFDTHYTDLFRYCLKFVRIPEIAEELVQDVLINIWDKKESLSIESSLKAYLIISVKNKALGYLRSKIAQTQFESEIPESTYIDQNPTEESLHHSELKEIIQKGIESLPEKCSAIFSLSRDAEMTYQEIADELGVSKKTVKAQVAIALKKLRSFLGDHWDKTLLLIISTLQNNLFFFIFFLGLPLVIMHLY